MNLTRRWFREADFYGIDSDGRTTCADGHCPAGTEERDGGCYPCDAGTASQAGENCKQCLAGRYSEAVGNVSIAQLVRLRQVETSHAPTAKPVILH